MNNDIPVKRGSGNVYRDLGFPDADALLLKAQVVSTIANLIREQNLTQAAAAEKIGVKQPDVSRLLAGKFDGLPVQTTTATRASAVWP